jgi:pilus assembly protein Flp/PilA
MKQADKRQKPWRRRGVGQILSDEMGATAIECALLSSLIAIALLTTLTTLGAQLSTEFSEVSSALK